MFFRVGFKIEGLFFWESHSPFSFVAAIPVFFPAATGFLLPLSFTQTVVFC